MHSWNQQMYACVRFADILKYNLIDKIQFRFIYNMRTAPSEFLMSDSWVSPCWVASHSQPLLSCGELRFSSAPCSVTVAPLTSGYLYTNFPLELLAIYKIVHLPRVSLFLLHCRKCCNADGRSNSFWLAIYECKLNAMNLFSPHKTIFRNFSYLRGVLY